MCKAYCFLPFDFYTHCYWRMQDLMYVHCYFTQMQMGFYPCAELREAGNLVLTLSGTLILVFFIAVVLVDLRWRFGMF